MIVVEVLLWLVAAWSSATVIRTGVYRSRLAMRMSGDIDPDSAVFMMISAAVLVLALGFLGLLLK